MKDWFKKILPYWPFALALCAGALFPFGLAPYNMSIATIVSVMLLLIPLGKAHWKRAAWIGLWYGIGLFGVGASWIYASIHDYGYAAPWLAFTITGLFILILSLFPAAQLSSLVKLFPENSTSRCLIAFPTWWVLWEIIRGWFLTGFPWLYVGYSQIDNHLASAFAPIGGVFLVSFFTVLLSCTLYSLIDYYYIQKNKPQLLRSLYLLFVCIWVLAYGIQKFPMVYPTGNTISVALVQGNIPQLLRWDPQAVTNIIRSYRDTTLALPKVDLVVWPESAIPLPLPLSASIFADMNTLLAARQMGLIAGVPSEVRNGMQYYNSLVGVGTASGIYHKHHLVPFGEYVPLEKLLRGLIGFFDLPMSAFIGASAHQSPLMLGPYRFAPAICYEIAYPFYVQSMSQNADVILTVSNDTWFGETIGPAQHMQIAQFRALENGKPLIRATNTGITALVDYKGEITDTMPQFEAQVLTGTIALTQGQTCWTRFGMWPLFLFLAALLGIAALKRKK